MDVLHTLPLLLCISNCQVKLTAPARLTCKAVRLGREILSCHVMQLTVLANTERSVL